MKRKIVLFAVAAVIAAVGASLVALYVNGVSDQAAAQEQMVKVLTATSEISAGEPASQAQAHGKLTLTTMPKSSVASGALSSIDAIGDQVALAPIYPGEQILAAKFGTTVASQQILPVPAGKVAISVELTDPGRVAGFVTPGAHVAIFVSVTGTNAANDGDFTKILVPDVDVIGVGPTTILSENGSDPPSGNDTEVPHTVLTVALSQRDAERVVFASENDTVTFGLLGRGTKILPDGGVHQPDLGG